MRPILTIALVAIAAAVLASGCSDNTALTAPSASDKRAPDLPPPPGPNAYLVALEEAFDAITWVPVQFEVNPAVGGTYTLLPDGYPADRPIIVNVGGNPVAGGVPVVCRIWVAAEPADGGYLDTPGDCILYRTENFPPAESPDATISLPVMRWYRSSNYTGHFATYKLGEDENGWPTREFVEGVSLPAWPPLDSESAVYVTVPGDPGVNEADSSVDLVAEPTEEPEIGRAHV